IGFYKKQKEPIRQTNWPFLDVLFPYTCARTSHRALNLISLPLKIVYKMFYLLSMILQKIVNILTSSGVFV
ncbi:hypothetical protein, partial [Acinetobacter baumannii]|uniref:hypothetical protein n=1 Tax=Acinetobacter baumannii TaxID=470 RepID=UPI0033214FBF